MTNEVSPKSSEMSLSAHGPNPLLIARLSIRPSEAVVGWATCSVPNIAADVGHAALCSTYSSSINAQLRRADALVIP
jgi:hypothetical protein